MSSYQKLCTEFYDLTKPQAPVEEVLLYTDFLKKYQPPYLEAMCGSGRLLLPLLKQGFNVEGVDNSAEMLASCTQRAEKLGIKPVLYNQSIADLNLPKKYSVIFIAIGSFQLIYNRAEAFAVLQAMYNQLLPGGLLLLDTFIPYEVICASNTGKIIERKQQEVAGPDEILLTLTSVTEYNVDEQYCHSLNHYEKYQRDHCIATEDEELTVRWYYPFEMELFLEKANFTKIKRSSHGAMILYEAIEE